MDTVYDRALLEVGPNGFFQKRFDLVYNVVLPALWAMAYMNIFLVMVVIPHSCQTPQKPHNVNARAWKTKFIPTIETSKGEFKFSNCKIFVNPDESNETKACDKYDYDKMWYESTVPAENDWVCDKEIYVPNIIIYGKIGDTIGSLFFGWFGDMYGRRLTYMISLAMLVLGRIISLVSSHCYLCFLCGCIIAGFPSWSVAQSTSIISLEISSAARRTMMASSRLISWSLGMSVLPLLYWWIREWKTFFMVTTATQIPFMLLSWNIIESPRWLWVEGKSEECIKYLKKIAKTNKTHLSIEAEQGILTMRSENKNIKSYGIMVLFSSWLLAKNTVLQLILSISVSVSFTVLLMSSSEKSEGNPFLELALQSLVELPGNFIGATLSDKFGRRFAGASSSALSTIIWALTAFRESSKHTSIRTWWLGSILAIANRLSTSITYYVINMFNMELYPTCMRQSGMSLGNVFSGAASAFAPYIIYMGHQYDSRLPGAILTVISLLGVLASILLPETLNTKLPETLEDAQAFGSKHCRYLVVRTK